MPKITEEVLGELDTLSLNEEVSFDELVMSYQAQQAEIEDEECL